MFKCLNFFGNLDCNILSKTEIAYVVILAQRATSH